MKTTITQVIEDGIEYKVTESAFHKSYSFEGKLHRMLGPAMEWLLDGEDAPDRFSWYYHGTHIKCSSQEEFERKIALKVFI